MSICTSWGRVERERERFWCPGGSIPVYIHTLNIYTYIVHVHHCGGALQTKQPFATFLFLHKPAEIRKRAGARVTQQDSFSLRVAHVKNVGFYFSQLLSR